MTIIRETEMPKSPPVREWRVGEFNTDYLIISIDDSDSSLHVEQPGGDFWMWLNDDERDGGLIIDEVITAFTEAKAELARRRA